MTPSILSLLRQHQTPLPPELKSACTEAYSENLKRVRERLDKVETFTDLFDVALDLKNIAAHLVMTAQRLEEQTLASERRR